MQWYDRSGGGNPLRRLSPLIQPDAPLVHLLPLGDRISADSYFFGVNRDDWGESHINLICASKIRIALT
ncbi:MAG: hypothetical protein HC890_17820 [Chloroflexaceae bacterium]|nr:hypothetical protein [Chloroflexaceae bacterium]